MTIRIKNYLQSRTLNPLTISKKMGRTVGDVIPVRDVLNIIDMMQDDFIEKFLNHHDAIQSEAFLTRQVCFRCNKPMIKQPEGRVIKPTREMKRSSMYKFTAWSWKCPMCGEQSRTFEDNCM